MPTDPQRALQALRDATEAFTEVDPDPEQTLRLALELLLRASDADAGAIAVPAESPELPPSLLVRRSLGEASLISMTVLQEALSNPEARPSLAAPPQSESVVLSGITSILCTPVRRAGKTIAAIYLDRRFQPPATLKPPFDTVALDLAATFAAVIALAFDLTRRVERAEREAEEARAAAVHARGLWSFGQIKTQSRDFGKCLQLAERAAQSDATIVLLGETGVGKEHLARCIHAASPRQSGPFLAVNCAALPETLLETELFGHERGAFTGAVQTRRGKFELCDGGTLLLDEIGELPLSMQPKLLRALEERRITRLGASADRSVDFRLLAATNRDLEQEVRLGRFREDLYYRLSVVSVQIPPLRERLEDVPQLAQSFLEQVAQRTGRKLRWGEDALLRLAAMSWPGNVRQLRNTVERLCVLASGSVIQVSEPEEVGPAARAPERQPAEPPADPRLQRRLTRLSRRVQGLTRFVEERLGPMQPTGASEPAGGYRERMDETERQILAQALRKNRSLSEAARSLGMTRQNFSLRCKRHGLSR